MRTMIRHKIRECFQEQPDLLKRFLVAEICGMAVFIGSTGLAPAQTKANLTNTSNATGQAQKAPDELQVQVYAPSDLAVLPSGVRADHPWRRPQGARAAARPTTAHQVGNIARPCFQPGIGWTARSVPADDRGPGQQNRESEPGVRSGANDCSTMPQSMGAASAEAGHQNHESEFNNRQLRLDASPASYDALANPIPPNSFPNDDKSGNGSSAMALPDLGTGRTVHDATHSSTELDELKTLQHRAYMSPVKLRRLARNVEDLRTRLQLRQMNSAMEKRATSQNSQSENTSSGKGNMSGRKKASRPGPFAKSECERKADTSKSKVCSLVNR